MERIIVTGSNIPQRKSWPNPVDTYPPEHETFSPALRMPSFDVCDDTYPPIGQLLPLGIFRPVTMIPPFAVAPVVTCAERDATPLAQLLSGNPQ